MAGAEVQWLQGDGSSQGSQQEATCPATRQQAAREMLHIALCSVPAVAAVYTLLTPLARFRLCPPATTCFLRMRRLLYWMMRMAETPPQQQEASVQM